MFSPSSPANVVSAALSATVMVMGFSSGESALSSEAFPVVVFYIKSIDGYDVGVVEASR